MASDEKSLEDQIKAGKVPNNGEIINSVNEAEDLKNKKIVNSKLEKVKLKVESSTEVSEAENLVGEGEQYANKRKNKLKPNIRYQAGEFGCFYETDDKGRITKFETDNLQLTEREDRLPHSKNTPGKIKGQDHAGHLAGDRFGGSPKLDNLVSQLSGVNLSKYKKLENQWEEALNDTPPKKVTVNVDIQYVGDDLRPSKFIVRYIIDGKASSVPITK